MPQLPEEPTSLEVEQIDQCTLAFGNCLDFIPQIDWHSIDLLLTDPPYGVEHITNFWITDESKRKRQRHRSRTTKFDKIENDNDLSVFSEMMGMVGGKLKAGASIYCFCSPRNVDEVLQIFKGNKYTIKNLLIWDKENWGAGDLKGAYGYQYEMIVFASKGKARRLNYRTGDILQYPRVPDPQLRHPYQKPDSLLTRLILNSSNEGEVIFDPFMGCGRVGVCCAKNHRRFIGCELDPGYYKESSTSIRDALGITKNLPLEELGEAISDD